MKQFSGFKAEKAAGAREILPAGGYVCEVKSVEIKEYSNNYSALVLLIEVIEGEYAGFFKKDYLANTREDKQWRGKYSVSIPRDDGSEMDGWTKRTFGNFVWAVQESNPGYIWDWDEKKLKGKKLGVIYRNREWERDGNTGWTTEAGGSASVEDIRSGSYRPLKDKPLKDRPVQSTAPAAAEDEDDLPF